MKPNDSINYFQKKDGITNTFSATVLVVSELSQKVKIKINGDLSDVINPVRWVSIKNCELQVETPSNSKLNYEDVRRKVKQIFDNNCGRTTKLNITNLSSSIVYHLTKNFELQINLGNDFYFPLISRETLDEIKIDLANEFGQVIFV